MADFPCQSERIAASALLLLSETTDPSVSRSIFDFVVNEEELMSDASKIRSCRGSLVSSDSKSSESSSELGDTSTDAISACSTRFIDVVPNCHEMNLKVVRKSRSKVQHISGGWKFSSGDGGCGGESSSTATSYGSFSVSGAQSSCLTVATTSSSTADSYVAQSRRDLSGKAEKRKRTHEGSAHIRRRAEGILKMLSYGSFSEVTIRQVLGDSPDTSKALRILLKLEKVKRTGIGGRTDPYIYMMATRDKGNSS